MTAFELKSALLWLIKKRLQSLRKKASRENKTVKKILEGTSIHELKVLKELIEKIKIPK